ETANGSVGAAVMLLENGKIIALNGNKKFPMQSVYKFPLAMAMLNQVDKGKISLDKKVSFDKSDYVSNKQHSPIRDNFPEGSELTVKELLRFMVSESDGSAFDILLKVIGGTENAQTYLRQLGIKDVKIATDEKSMGTDDETVQYQNWAKPKEMAKLLRIFFLGKNNLSASSREVLLELMIKTETGLRRLKGNLPEGTIVAHKTGTSRTVNGITRATNDVGIITLPDGRHLIVVVFVSDAKTDANIRENVIADIAKTAWDFYVK
ncbi:MAG: class A beta-lactamase, partial [Pyrinomonadaceae bacterium]|nr:class A beta-lactamase [Pyrinomonadaceae bacterium]